MLVWWKLYYVRAILPAKEKLSATKQNRRNIFQCSLQIMVALRGRPRYVIAVVTLTRHHYNVLLCRLSVAYYIKSVPSGPLYQSWCDYVFWQLATAPNHQVSKSQWNSDGSLQNITVFFPQRMMGILTGLVWNHLTGKFDWLFQNVIVSFPDAWWDNLFDCISICFVMSV